MAEDPPGIKTNERTQYYTQLGHFVAIFAVAEAMMKEVLKNAAGADDRMALALFSGVRAAEACSLIRRTYEARGIAVSADLESLLSHFAVLTALRNDLVHHGINFRADPPLVSNKGSVLNVRAVREVEIKGNTLILALSDCARIVTGLMPFAVADDLSQPFNADFSQIIANAVHRPWQYKPTQPAHRDQETPRQKAPRPKRTPPPKP